MAVPTADVPLVPCFPTPSRESGPAGNQGSMISVCMGLLSQTKPPGVTAVAMWLISIKVFDRHLFCVMRFLYRFNRIKCQTQAFQVI